MIRRAQLLGSGSRAADRVVAASVRIRDGLLRDNKVIPAVLAVLALLIFAWILAGVLIGGEPGEEKAGQVAGQASQAQAFQDSDSGGPETPAPGVENRDTDSYSAFEKKDPFGDIGLEKADDDGGGSDGGGGDNGSGNGSGGGDSIDQSFPGDPDFGESGGRSGDRGSDGGGADRSGGGRSGGGGAGQGAGTGQGGSDDDLFDSGGNLVAP